MYIIYTTPSVCTLYLFIIWIMFFFLNDLTSMPFMVIVSDTWALAAISRVQLRLMKGSDPEVQSFMLTGQSAAVVWPILCSI